MQIEIAPALEEQEWKDLRCGCIAIDQVGDETHIVVTDPDGEVVSVSGPQELFALIALANAALPDGDPRKITRNWIEQLLDGDRASRAGLANVLSALLPACGSHGA